MQSINVPAVPSLTVGNVAFTDLKNLIILYGSFSGAANGNSTLRKQNGATGYTPSGAKSFRVKAIRVSIQQLAANQALFLHQSNNDVGIGVATAAIGPVYIGGALGTSNVCSAGVVGTFEIACDFLVANTRYLFSSNNASAANGTIQVFGYEE